MAPAVEFGCILAKNGSAQWKFQANVLVSVKPYYNRWRADMSAYPTGVGFRGLNRAGAEYGDDWDGWNGQTFYTFPTEAELDAELTAYAAKGFNTIRLPISWERLQHSLNGPLDTVYANRVLAFASQANTAGWLVIVDLHNYNRYATGAFDGDVQVDTYEQLVFGDGLDASHLSDVWTRIATMFLGNPDVVFNIMNEPHDFKVESDNWFADIQTVMDAIRATGADQLILVPNSRGSDVDHWDTYAPNGGSLDSAAALAIADFADNFAFDMHAYQDLPESSTSYVELVTPVTEWARLNGKRLFLSELGVVNEAPKGELALGNLLEYLNDNSDIWIGWTTWNLPPYNISQDGDYTADGPEMVWYTPHLTPNIVSGGV
jgi:endoglucanase